MTGWMWPRDVDWDYFENFTTFQRLQSSLPRRFPRKYWAQGWQHFSSKSTSSVHPGQYARFPKRASVLVLPRCAPSNPSWIPLRNCAIRDFGIITWRNTVASSISSYCLTKYHRLYVVVPTGPTQLCFPQTYLQPFSNQVYFRLVRWQPLSSIIITTSLHWEPFTSTLSIMLILSHTALAASAIESVALLTLLGTFLSHVCA